VNSQSVAENTNLAGIARVPHKLSTH